MESIKNILPRIELKHVVESGNNTRIIPFVRKPEVCQICKGAGFTRDDVPYGHPNFGKSVPCKCKIAARKIQQQQELLELSGITSLKRFRDASFETFTTTLLDVQKAYKYARQFAACPLGWFVMTGPYGCGKTHLAVAIAKQRVEAGDTVLVQTVPDLLDRLRSSFSADTEQSFDDMFQQMRDVDLLVLDDYGAEQGTNWAKEKMFQIFNHRYNKSLPTVVTSNNIHLQDIDPRVYSRLCDRDLVTLIKMQGARDYRIYGDSQDEEE